MPSNDHSVLFVHRNRIRFSIATSANNLFSNIINLIDSTPTNSSIKPSANTNLIINRRVNLIDSTPTNSAIESTANSNLIINQYIKLIINQFNNFIVIQLFNLTDTNPRCAGSVSLW